MRLLIALLFSTMPLLAQAEEPQVEFSFPDFSTLLPAGISHQEVLTIATERKGDIVEGVILLTRGRSFHFIQTQTQPLLQEELMVAELN